MAGRAWPEAEGRPDRYGARTKGTLNKSQMPVLAKHQYEKIALALAGGDSIKNAYIAGGYSYNPANATRTCQRREIVERVAEIKAERAALEARTRVVAAEEAGVDRAWIIRHLKINALGALRGDPMRDRAGRLMRDETGAQLYHRPDRAAANKALELLGRSEGIFVDRTEVGGPGDFSRLADDELDAAIVDVSKALRESPEGLKLLEHLSAKETSE